MVYFWIFNVLFSGVKLITIVLFLESFQFFGVKHAEIPWFYIHPLQKMARYPYHWKKNATVRDIYVSDVFEN